MIRTPSPRTVADLRALVDLHDGAVPLHAVRRVLGRSATASERRVVGVRLVGDALVSIPSPVAPRVVLPAQPLVAAAGAAGSSFPRGGPPGSVGVSSEGAIASEARCVSSPPVPSSTPDALSDGEPAPAIPRAPTGRAAPSGPRRGVLPDEAAQQRGRLRGAATKAARGEPTRAAAMAALVAAGTAGLLMREWVAATGCARSHLWGLAKRLDVVGTGKTADRRYYARAFAPVVPPTLEERVAELERLVATLMPRAGWRTP